MRPEDIRKIRKRIDSTLDNFSNVYGCYVNAASEIVSTMEIPVLDMQSEEKEMYAAIFKKVLSGTPDRNRFAIEMPISMVGDSDQHRLLMAVKEGQGRDENMRNLLYRRIIDSLQLEDTGYVILLAFDTCDLRTCDTSDEEWSEESNSQFEYFICAICPVKLSKAALQYRPHDREFRGISTGSLLSPPALGFMFPAFEEGAADIGAAEYYSRSASENHGELISGLFMLENPPMAAEVQKDTFNFTLSEALGGDCRLELVTALQANLQTRAEAAKEENSAEMPRVDVEEIGDILAAKGISEEKVRRFTESVGERFDGAGSFNVNNIIQKKTFEVRTSETRIVTDPANALRIKTRCIDGVTYLLVPVGEGATVNGVEITL